ncbi:MAG: heavy-metal-associated domain-containing protein [Ruminococcus sp.]|nr:heavy-metal-associated domain-containing protein [Ruminococcus sp.]
MNTSTAIVLLIIIVIVVLAIKPSIKHMKGQGGCCGGGDVPKPKKKRLDSPIVATKILTIEGMHCDNCKNRVEKAINSLDGAVGKVNLKKKVAKVSMSHIIDDDTLKSVIESLDFKVTQIESI